MFPIIYYVHCSVFSLELTIEIVFMQIYLIIVHLIFIILQVKLWHNSSSTYFCNFPQPYLNHGLFLLITDVKKMILYTKWKKISLL